MPSRLEQYLDEVSRPLPLGPQRTEWRTEAEQHLTALIAAYEELGHSHEEATELALNRFGEAETVGHQIRTETRRTTSGMRATMAFLLPVVFCFLLMFASAFVYAQTGDERVRAGMLTAGRIFDILAPWLGGVWVARRVQSGVSLRDALLVLLVGIDICFIGATFALCVSDPLHTPHPADILPKLPVWFAFAAASAFITSAARRSRRIA